MNSDAPVSARSDSAAGVVFLDVDGTLVPPPGSAVHVARYLGSEDEAARLEEAYAAGEAGNHEVAVAGARAWAGHTEAEIDIWLDGVPLVGGIAEVGAWCRARWLLPVLATLAWEPVAAHLARRFGFAAWCGAEPAVAGGRYTGDLRTGLDEYGKRDFALRYAKDRHLAASSCAAIGDSRSDVPLFAETGLAVAFNGDRQARAAAHEAVDGDDLRAVLPVLQHWLDRA